MADRFETKMNKKMEGLKIAPSDAVWQNVERIISENRRKKKPLWLFLIPAIVISGIAVLIYSSRPNFPETMKMTHNQAMKTDTLNLNESDHFTKQHVPADLETKEFSRIKVEKTPAIPSVDAGTKPRMIRANEHANNPGTSRKASIPQKTDSATDSYSSLERSSSTVEPMEIVPPEQAVLGDSLVTKTFSTSDPLMPQKGEYRKPVKGWEVIVELSPGISTTGSLFSTAKSSRLMLQNSTAEPVPGYTFPTDVELKSRIGMQADILLKKSIGKNLSLSTGLQYQYFSVRGRLTQSAQYGNYNRPVELSFTDQFHYIGIPLNLYFDNHKKLPFSLQAGISFNYLIGNTSTTSLDSAIRLKVNNSFNKINAGIQGAMLFDIIGTRQYKLQGGPFIFSSFLPIATEGTYADSRFMFLGLKATFSLKDR